MSLKLAPKGIILLLSIGVIFAGCSSSDSTTASGPVVSLPAYTVVQEAAGDPLTEDAAGCLVFPSSFAMISFDGGIPNSTARYEVTGTWNAADSFISLSAFSTVAGTDASGGHAVGFFVDDTVLDPPSALGVNTLVLLDTTGNPPATGTIFVSEGAGFPTVASGDTFSLSADFIPASTTALSWWPNTADLTATPSGDVFSTGMSAPSGTAAVLSALTTTVCSVGFGAVP